MLSRFSTCASSLSPHILHQEFIHPCVTGPHLLQHVLFWHRLSQQQASTSEIFTFPSISERESRESRLSDGPLKYFVRCLTDGRKTHHSHGVELQVSSPWQSDGKEADGEVKLSQSKKLEVGLGNDIVKLHLQSENAKEEGSVNSKRVKQAFWKSASRSITDFTDHSGKNEDSATEISKQVKVISNGSKKFAEVYTVGIRRKLTSQFLHHLQEKIDFLHSAAIPIIQVKVLLKKQAFLSASPEKLVAVVEVLTEIFESKSIALKVLAGNAGILKQPLEMSKHKMHLLSQFGIDRRACIKLATTKGKWILNAQKYEERLNFLKGLGMNAQARSNVIYRCPIVLAYSKSFLRGTVDSLESIGFCGPQLLKFLEVRPSMFCSSADKSLAVRLKLFQDWGFSVNDILRALRQLPLRSPQLMESQFKLLMDYGFAHDDVSRIIRIHPSVVANPGKLLKAKLDFLRQVNRDVLEVLKYPKYLAYSLEDRIIPRFKALEAVELRKKPALSAILSCRTTIFKKRFNIPESVTC